MKKFIIIMAIIAMAMPLTLSAQKFGIVTVETVYRDLPDVAKAQKELEGVAAKYQREDSVLQRELQVKYEDFQKISQDAATPQSIKERRLQEIQDMNAKYEQFRQNAQQDLQRQQETLFAPIQLKLQNAIKAVGDAGAYTFIFTGEVPAYVGKDVVDATPELRKQLGL